MIIRFSNFRGLYPKLDRYYARPENSAEKLCMDCLVRSGTLQPRSTPRQIGSVATGMTGLLALENDRFIGLERPCKQVRLHNMVIAVDGANPMFYARRGGTTAQLYRLGVPRPMTALAAAVSNEGTDAQMQETVFAYTYVDANGMESQAGGEFSINTRLDATITVTLPAITNYQSNTGLQYDEDNVKRRLYQSSFDAQLHFVEEVEGAQSRTVSYSLEDDSGGGVRQALDTDALPPEDATHIVNMPGNFLAANDGTRVRFSRANEHNVWPEAFAYEFGRRVIAIERDVDILYVMLEGAAPSILNAPDPESVQIYESEIPWQCIAPQSVINTGYGVFYASHSGIVALQGTRGQLITRNHFDDRTFRDFNPRRIRAYSADGIYYCYANERPFILDTQAISAEFEISELSLRPTDAKIIDGIPYTLTDELIYRHEPGVLKHQYSWQSAPVRLQRSFIFRALQCRAEFDLETPLPRVIGGIGSFQIGAESIGTVKPNLTEIEQSEAQVAITILDSDGVALHENPVICRDQLPYPAISVRKRDAVAICVSANVPVHSVALASTQRDLKNAIT